MAAAEWLTAKARSYHQDARRLEQSGTTLEAGGLDGAQWAIIYRAIAEELNKCAKETA